LFCVGQWLC